MITKDQIIKEQANIIAQQQGLIKEYTKVLSPEELAKRLHNK